MTFKKSLYSFATNSRTVTIIIQLQYLLPNPLSKQNKLFSDILYSSSINSATRIHPPTHRQQLSISEAKEHNESSVSEQGSGEQTSFVEKKCQEDKLIKHFQTYHPTVHFQIRLSTCPSEQRWDIRVNIDPSI